MKGISVGSASMVVRSKPVRRSTVSMIGISWHVIKELIMNYRLNSVLMCAVGRCHLIIALGVSASKKLIIGGRPIKGLLLE